MFEGHLDHPPAFQVDFGLVLLEKLWLHYVPMAGVQGGSSLVFVLLHV